MKPEIYNAYVKILHEELVPAMGCTEPIAIAYASALARDTLGTMPERMEVPASGNLIKNVTSVVVPNTTGLKGIEAAVAAGVVGSTGVESAELIRALVREIEPGFVIAIDALASRSAQRLGKTVQIADTGITPGSGVGNARAELSRQTLGIPVIALGVPTVVDAGTLAADLSGREPDGDLELERMMVTPREIDTLAADTGKVVGYGVSLALQTGLDVADLELLLG